MYTKQMDGLVIIIFEIIFRKLPKRFCKILAIIHDGVVFLKLIRHWTCTWAYAQDVNRGNYFSANARVVRKFGRTRYPGVPYLFPFRLRIITHYYTKIL